MMDKVSMLPKITSYYVDVYAHSYGCPPLVTDYTGANCVTMTSTRAAITGASSKPTSGFDYQLYGSSHQEQRRNLLLRHQV
ncbi:unnamed protein product [Ambrosiozyma monospora]|uniref:Unnamed protein product n=1 Tax=Ambrosiozyma monospora TaxID=43982 RepID=A0ACB5TF21_AMBMO|nr:unnamed protein product [Ambrosiozyma monospora]